MAFTQLTSGQGPETPKPDYQALMQGASQASAYRTQGVKTKADMITEGLKTFDKNQQLLSEALGTYRGALAASEEFKKAVELEIGSGTDLGKSFEQMSKGNVSLPAALAAQSFAESYGVGKTQQAQNAYNQSLAAKNTAEIEAINTGAIVEGSVRNFMYNHHKEDGRLDIASAMKALQKITPEVVAKKLNIEGGAANPEIQNYVAKFRNESAKYIQEQNELDNLYEPAFNYELKKASNGDEYIINEKGDITAFRAPKSGEDTMAVFDANIKQIDEMIEDGSISVSDGNAMKNRLIYSFQTQGLGLDTSAGYAGFLTNSMNIPMYDVNGKINPSWIKTWTLLATANQSSVKNLQEELITVTGYGSQGVFADIPPEQRATFLNTMLSVLDRVASGQISIEQLQEELKGSRPVPELVE